MVVTTIKWSNESTTGGGGGTHIDMYYDSYFKKRIKNRSQILCIFFLTRQNDINYH